METANTSFKVLPAGQIPVPPQVLCYGHDRMLRYTRQRILGMLGCSAQLVATAAECRAYLLGNAPGVIILCQSLTGQECDDMVDFAAQVRPDSRVLIMYARTLPNPMEKPYRVLAAADGPKAFVQATLALL